MSPCSIIMQAFIRKYGNMLLDLIDNGRNYENVVEHYKQLGYNETQVARLMHCVIKLLRERNNILLETPH